MLLKIWLTALSPCSDERNSFIAANTRFEQSWNLYAGGLLVSTIHVSLPISSTLGSHESAASPGSTSALGDCWPLNMVHSLASHKLISCTSADGSNIIISQSSTGDMFPPCLAPPYPFVGGGGGGGLSPSGIHTCILVQIFPKHWSNFQPPLNQRSQNSNPNPNRPQRGQVPVQFPKKVPKSQNSKMHANRQKNNPLPPSL
mmetsp:Transcript_19892/g.32723  ORF Transcript_19892/g.32723 Transcript_19892/m.32723 type:complete len:201 (+) Transcript_19892:1776-2378(+)